MTSVVSNEPKPRVSAEPNPAWLIEMLDKQGGAVLYYCGPGEWSNHAGYARRFKTRAEAKTVLAEFVQLFAVNYRVAEHAWMTDA